MNQQIEIARIGQKGQGVGYDEAGNIYFVPGTVPGDRVDVEFSPTAKRYRDATLVRIVRPAPSRTPSPCPYFSRCGGCDWLDWEYPAQLAAKEAVLTHTLERAGLVPQRRLPIVGASRTLGYRNRIQLRSEGGRIGFYRRRTHEIVDIEHCAVAAPEINAELARLRQEEALPRRHKIELVQGPQGVQRFYDAPHGAGGFRQVHEEQNERLRELVAGRLAEAGSRQVLELYCGNGNLTYAFLPQIEEVIAVDSNEAALAEAREKRPLGAKAAFVASTIDPKLRRRLPPEFAGQYDTLVLDPPRSGTPCLDKFVHARLNHIIYVSCSPTSFAQDVRGLLGDFQFYTVQAIDMFPQTRHVELVAWFSR